jgi:hypothetical protein
VIVATLIPTKRTEMMAAVLGAVVAWCQSRRNGRKGVMREDDNEGYIHRLG